MSKKSIDINLFFKENPWFILSIMSVLLLPFLGLPIQQHLVKDTESLFLLLYCIIMFFLPFLIHMGHSMSKKMGKKYWCLFSLILILIYIIVFAFKISVLSFNFFTFFRLLMFVHISITILYTIKIKRVLSQLYNHEFIDQSSIFSKETLRKVQIKTYPYVTDNKDLWRKQQTNRKDLYILATISMSLFFLFANDYGIFPGISLSLIISNIGSIIGGKWVYIQNKKI